MFCLPSFYADGIARYFAVSASQFGLRPQSRPVRVPAIAHCVKTTFDRLLANLGDASLAEFAIRPLPPGGQVWRLLISVNRECISETVVAESGNILADPPSSSRTFETSNRLLPSVVEAMPCPVAAAGPDGAIRAANAAWNRLAQPEASSALARHSLGDLFPDAASAAAEVLRAGGAVSRRALPLARGPSGAATWWDLDLVPHPEAAGVVLATAREVTDHVLARREAEDARATIEPIATRFHLAQEAAGIGTWEWNANSDRQAWSPHQFRLYGFDPATAVPPSLDEWIAMVHPEDQKLIRNAIGAGFDKTTNRSYRMQFRIRRADTGAERWLLSFGRIMERSDDGRIVRILGVNLDITEHRNEQQALRENEALLRLASEAAGVYAWDWDIATGRVTWAEGLEQALGLPAGGFGGTVDAFRAMVHPDDAPDVEAAIHRALAGDTATYAAKFRMRRADGTTRWTETRGTVLRDDRGQPCRLVGMDHDITEREAAESALLRHKAQQAAVAGLGQFALAAPSAQSVMDAAARTLSETLDVEFAKVLELRQGGQELLLRAGVGWSDAYPVGRTFFSAGRQSQAGYTLLLDSGPVIVHDLRSEVRFSGPPLLRDHGVVSGLSVIIRGIDGGSEAYGVLSAHSTQRRQFTDHDIRFLEAVANLITSTLQRERAETALRQHEAQLRLFIERAPVALAMFDADMRYLAASQRFITDYAAGFNQPADVVGQLHAEILPNLPQAWRDTHTQLLDGEAAAESNGTFVRPDGRTEAVRWEMTAWHADDGAAGGTLLFAELTTARRATEAALTESEAEFRALAETMPQLIYASSPAGFSEYKNQRWYDYSGQTREQAHGAGWVAMLHPDDRDTSITAWQQSIATGQPYEREHRLRGQDGQYRWFLSRATPLRAPDDGRIIRWLGTSTDISDIINAREVTARWAATLEAQVAERTRALTEAAVELEAEMRRRQDVQAALQQSQKLEALGQLTAGVAHDFNNVLSAIQGSLELIERRTEDPRLLQLVALGMSATGRATSLTRQLLNFGRSDALVPMVLDVEAAIDRADEMIGQAVGSRYRRFKEVQDGVWPVLTDPNQLEIALLNLAINARDAMPDSGEISLSARNLTPHERPESLTFKDYVSISLRDSGQGMPPDVVARATEPFFTTKPEGKGTGLGLPMVHAFALRSGGCLRIESEPGVGTTVEIILPRASVTGMDQGDPAPNGWSTSDRPATILVVEDDDQVRQITVGYLRDRGYIVIDAQNAETAMVLSHAIPELDLLLSDVAMPGAEGPELARRMRAERPDLAVLFITGNAGRPDLAAEHVLLKPFTGEDLVKAISRRLNRAQNDASDNGSLLHRLRNPGLEAAFLFWRAAGNGGKPPRLTDLDWGGLPNAENTFTVAVDAEGSEITFRYLRVGSTLQARLGRPIEGTSVTAPADLNPDHEVLGLLGAAYARCARTSAPSYDYARYDFGDEEPLLFERLILPLSDDGERITHLIGVVMFSSNA